MEILSEKDLNKSEKQEPSYFDKNLNISYIPPDTPKADNRIIIKHYICSLIVYGFALLLYWFNPFFSGETSLQVKLFFRQLYIYYIFIAPILYFFYRPKSIRRSHTIEICNYIKRIFLHKPSFKTLEPEEIKNELEYYKPTYLEKQSLMLIFIKVFFGALMVTGLFNNMNIIQDRLPMFVEIKNVLLTYFTTFNGSLFDVLNNTYRQFLYYNFILVMFSIDLMIFCFGYLTELGILNNKIRTVETTPAGILFCLACYPPFLFASNAFFGWNQSDNAIAFGNDNSPLTWGIRFAAMVFLFIYVSASAALGTKGSNLTNRGTVSCFPYNIVRHPAYISKNIFWILTTIPLFLVDFNASDFNSGSYLSKLILTCLAAAIWVSIYYFRALTEERHLINDPEYQEYVKKVRYRFIPGLF